MEYDENDILFTNSFLKPTGIQQLSHSQNDEFKRYYTDEMDKKEEKVLKDSLDRMSIRSVYLDEETDGTNLMNTQRFTRSTELGISQELQLKQQSTDIKRYRKEVRTFVNIDSRDRDTSIYPKPNKFKLFLGKTFYNVKTIRLASIEFPNTNAVINAGNNKVYWRNQQDVNEDIIDDITKEHPIYSVDLNIGSYISTSLQNELVRKMGSIKRENYGKDPDFPNSDFHFFIVDLDITTDIVTFTSLTLSELGNNAMSVASGSGTIIVEAPNHGLTNGMEVYILGTKALAGIPSTTLNGFHTITWMDSNTFKFDVNIKAGDTATGGGNTIQVGKKAPFQLLFGEYTQTIASNIGFPLENSSIPITTYIKSIENIYQLQITTSAPHRFKRSFDYIGKTCFVTGASPINGNRLITGIINDNTFLIQYDNKLDGVIESGLVTFEGSFFDIVSVTNLPNDTVRIKTFTNHDYNFIDIGTTLTLTNTSTIPKLDGTHHLFSVLSNTEFVILSSVFVGGQTSVTAPGDGGSIPRHNPLETKVLRISNVTSGSPFTTIQTATKHGFTIGQRVKLIDLVTSPSILLSNSGEHYIHSIPDDYTFTIMFATTSVSTTSIDDGAAFVSCLTITCSFPSHGFNSIVNIASQSNTVLKITTKLDHNLSSGDKVRITANGNSVANTISLNGYYQITRVDNDEFTIPFAHTSPISGSDGILGLSFDFYLYSAEPFGGLTTQNINNVKYTVLDVIDENTFTFDANSFPTYYEKGGGSNVYISSLKHGFNAIQRNTKNNLLNRSINLEGENYAFLCSPQLATMMNTGSVKNIFARITLDQSPGNVVFSYLSNPKEFETVPQDKLSELEFSIVNYDNSLYSFNNLDFSFVLEITEVVDTTDSFNFSSRRGTVN
jgi:hypothetical protein